MKRNGFVFAETIVVVAVLSIGLIMLYSLFSRLYLSESRRVSYDNSEELYHVYHLKEFLEENDLNKCFYKFEDGQMYSKIKTTISGDPSEVECDLFPDVNSDNAKFYYAVLADLNIQDIYITNYDVTYLKNSDAIYRLDATLINYIKTLSTNEDWYDSLFIDAYRIIVKFADDTFASLKIGGETNYFDIEIEINDAIIEPNNIRVSTGTTQQFNITTDNPSAYIDVESVASCGGTLNGKVMTIDNINTDIQCNILVKRPTGRLNDYIINDNSPVKTSPSLKKVAVSNSVYNSLPATGSGLSKANAVVENGLYRISTNYFYRGDVENNYLVFAGKLWRIVGINSDNSIRIILNDGFLNNYNNYTNTSDSMYYVNSRAKIALDEWLNVNTSSSDSRLINGSYCDSLNAVINTSNGGTLFSSYTPNFHCNGYGNYRVGLITYDELILAGGYNAIPNHSYYLNFDESYYSMSPAGFDNVKGHIWGVRAEGTVFADDDYGTNKYLRPVVNIIPNLNVTGFGTLSAPYEVIN